jgi:hypothetical protein
MNDHFSILWGRTCCKQAISPTIQVGHIVGEIAIFRQLAEKRKRPRPLSHGTLAEQPSPEVCSPPPYLFPRNKRMALTCAGIVGEIAMLRQLSIRGVGWCFGGRISNDLHIGKRLKADRKFSRLRKPIFECSFVLSFDRIIVYEPPRFQIFQRCAT